MTPMFKPAVSFVTVLMAAVTLSFSLPSVVDGRSVDKEFEDAFSALSSSSSSEPHFPTSVEELFADVYNNNSVSMLLQSKTRLHVNRTIKEIAPGAFMAYNYAMGNSMWVVTPEHTIIVIDCPESVEIATLIRNDMRKIPAIGNKPITFIIFTIFHGDHTFGARAYIDDPANGGQQPTIIAHKNLMRQAELFDIYRFLKFKRIVRAFGSILPKSVKIVAWVPLQLGKVLFTEFWPTVLLNMEKAGDTEDLILNGLPMRFVYIPGYTADQIAVWFPTTRLMACADTFYSMFPNMYTVRGEPPRDAIAWSQTVRIVRSYQADVLFPQHESPIFGRQHISDVLERLADAMQYVHDQTLRQLAKGKTPDVIAPALTMPKSLAEEPNLIQSYGFVETASKAVADHYVGWFDGEAEDLLPVSKSDLAELMVRDFGRDVVLDRARAAYEAGEYRWAATLASYVWRAEGRLKNDALYWRAQALKRLAESTISVHLRQYLYTTTMIDWGFVDSVADGIRIRSRPGYLGLRTIENCFELMRLHVDPVKAEGVNATIDLRVTDDPSLDESQVYRMRLLNSVLWVEKVDGVNPKEPRSLHIPLVQTDSSTWRQILAGKITVDEAIFSNGMRIVFSGATDIRDFLLKFDFDDEV